MSNLLESLEQFIADTVAAEVAKQMAAIQPPAQTEFSRNEAAKVLRVSVRVLARYEQDGLIARRPNGAGVWFTLEEVENCRLRLAGKLARIVAPIKPRGKRARLKENVAAV
jgi:hypothetical protein